MITKVPEDFKFAETHEWIRVDGDIGTVGISDHAQAELTDIVFVEIPKIGARFSAKDPAAVVESVKAASDIYAPVSGEIVEANEGLAEGPSLLNTEPYGSGWIFKIRIADASELGGLLDPSNLSRADFGDAVPFVQAYGPLRGIKMSAPFGPSLGTIARTIPGSISISRRDGCPRPFGGGSLQISAR
jgi:glycine cleavage system H protein